MRIALALLLAVHGLIHLMGFAKPSATRRCLGPGHAAAAGGCGGAVDRPARVLAEQHSFFDPPRRYFFMQATRAGLSLDGLHAYAARWAPVQNLHMCGTQTVFLPHAVELRH